MDIIVNNPLQRLQLLNGLLRVLRHVKSSVVCAATVWAISVSTVPRKDVCRVLTAISSHFKDMLEQRKIEKQINGVLEVQHGFTLYTDHYSASMASHFILIIIVADREKQRLYLGNNSAILVLLWMKLEFSCFDM
jgi:hypothetical protein